MYLNILLLVNISSGKKIRLQLLVCLAKWFLNILSPTLNGDKKIFVVRLLQNNFKILTMYMYAYVQSNSKSQRQTKTCFRKRNPFLIPFGRNIHDHKYLSKKSDKKAKKEREKNNNNWIRVMKQGEAICVLSFRPRLASLIDNLNDGLNPKVYIVHMHNIFNY